MGLYDQLDAAVVGGDVNEAVYWEAKYNARFVEAALAHRQPEASIELRDGWMRRELGSRGWGCSFQVPASWRYEADDLGERMRVAPTPGQVECVEVVLTTIDHAASLERYAAAAIEALRTELPGASVEERDFTRLGHVDAYQVTFTFQARGEALRAWRVLAMNGNQGHRLTYVARTDVFARHLETAREIVATYALVPGPK